MSIAEASRSCGAAGRSAGVDMRSLDEDDLNIDAGVKAGL